MSSIVSHLMDTKCCEAVALGGKSLKDGIVKARRTIIRLGHPVDEVHLFKAGNVFVVGKLANQLVHRSTFYFRQ